MLGPGLGNDGVVVVLGHIQYNVMITLLERTHLCSDVPRAESSISFFTDLARLKRHCLRTFCVV